MWVCGVCVRGAESGLPEMRHKSVYHSERLYHRALCTAAPHCTAPLYCLRLDDVYLRNLELPVLVERARRAVVARAADVLRDDPQAGIDQVVLDLPCSFFALRALRCVGPRGSRDGGWEGGAWCCCCRAVGGSWWCLQQRLPGRRCASPTPCAHPLPKLAHTPLCACKAGNDSSLPFRSLTPLPLSSIIPSLPNSPSLTAPLAATCRW